MQLFQGTVSQIRALATTTSTSTSSRTRHTTTLKFGAHSMTLKTVSVPPIHLGDDLVVYGRKSNGAVRPFLVRNRSNGYQTGLGTWQGVSATFAVCVVLGGMFFAGDELAARLATVAFVAAPIVVLHLRHAALKAMSSAKTEVDEAAAPRQTI